jgi:aspartate aminotransferase/aromatic-amino-acid transaminase
MFEDTPTAPSDPIFGLTAAFLRDENPAKINLGAGVFRNEAGSTPILGAVKEAERRIWQEENSKTYLPIEGDPRYARHVRRLMLGDDHPLVDDPRCFTVHTPGGTGALRLAADFLRRDAPERRLWIPDPTWLNHAQIGRAARLEVETYPYLDPNRRRLDLAGMLVVLSGATAGDVVVVHGCCHNPSGIDPAPDQWRQLADLFRERGLLPLVDFAYLGFGQGLEADRAGVVTLVETVGAAMICTSFSKNFALYSERVGALTVVAPTAESATAVLSQIKHCARVSYSNPPAHGGALVTAILDSEEMRRQWHEELAAMRQRIVDMRRLFVEGLDRRGVQLSSDGNGFLTEQQGMFSFLGLSTDQVARLRTEFSIYIVGSSRVNFASMTRASMDYLCDAIAQVS